VKIRLMTTRDVPLLTEYGISANNERWTDVDIDKLSPADRRGLVSARGRLVNIHPDDEQKFADLEASLKYEDESKSEPPAPKKK
jgi:hypothetical protein